MPRVDGIDFVKRLRRLASFHRTPTVAVTSLMLPGDMAATREAGFDGHLLKPITRDMIGRVLRRAVSERPPPPNA
jgi:CheY-like chemotaxis protein